MTSKQVMLVVVALLLGGCTLWKDKPAEPLRSPYADRRVWAVAPLRNESGSLQVDGTILADHVARQLENASNLDVLPVNRTLEAMAALQMPQVNNPQDALRLLEVLGVDGLVVGTVSAYDPYDPPKLGLAIELYASPRVEPAAALDVRRLSTAATPDALAGSPPSTQAAPYVPPPSVLTPRGANGARLGFRPVNVVSAFLDAADPHTREMMQAYAVARGPEDEPDAWRRYRISMDLYSEFASYVVSWRLMAAEWQRVAPPATQPAH